VRKKAAQVLIMFVLSNLIVQKLMKTVVINTAKLSNWNSFHSYFKRTFGFPEFYGNNLNAWIDCMTSLDEPSHGMTTKITLRKGELIIFKLLNVEDSKKSSRDIYDALIESSAFVNHRRIQVGDTPLIVLSF
jgi:RNAse (barnase) inhibitor barstar